MKSCYGTSQMKLYKTLCFHLDSGLSYSLKSLTMGETISHVMSNSMEMSIGRLTEVSLTIAM